MPDQFDLPGFDPLPEPPRRERATPRRRPEGPNTVFFALVLDPARSGPILELQARLRADEKLIGRPIAAARLHVTLHDLGGHDEPSVVFLDAARRAAGSISMPSFEIVFDRVRSFPRQRGKPPCVLESSGELGALTSLRHELGLAISAAGLWRHEAATPHMTLLYDARTVGPRPIEPVSWRVNEFALVQSFVGKGVHERLGTWPLHNGGARDPVTMNRSDA